jgi:hypothetical protein
MEYITSGVIIFLILGVSGQYASNMVFDRMNNVENNARIGKAEKIIDLLILSPGEPPNWGDAFGEPGTLGLSLENAVKINQLDEKKVRRLDLEDPNYIPPGRVRDLLGVRPNYYISIRIMPIFNITIQEVSQDIFSIKVYNQWSQPVSNVDITAAYSTSTVADLKEKHIASFLDGTLEDAVYTNGMTDSLGSCTVDFTASGPRPTLLVSARQISARSMTTWPTSTENVIGTIESSMGTISGYETETVYRNVEIGELNYIIRFTMWR